MLLSLRPAIAGATLAVTTLLGCSGNPATGPAGTPAHSPVSAAGHQGLVQGIGGLWILEVQPDPLAVRLTPARASQTVQQQFLYHLDIEQFLDGGSLAIREFGFDPAGDLRVTFALSHPFPAPDLTAPPSGRNRADLGVSANLVILADVPTAEIPQRTFFGNRVVHTGVVRDADGYLQPGDLLFGRPSTNANLFPYKLTVDEALDNREGVTNGGDPTGNYDPAQGGWQQFNISNGSVDNGWTGYDFLHQGQTAVNSFTLAQDALETPGGLRLDLAVLVKYQDPRGTAPRNNPLVRFPQPSPADVDVFAYRLPYAAWDVSVVEEEGAQGGNLTVEANSSGTRDYAIRDWDAAATETTFPNLGDDPDISHIQQGASGTPDVTVSFPALSATPFPAVLSAPSSGIPGEELIFTASLVNTLGTAPAETPLPGLVEVRDPEDEDPDRATYTFGVDPETLLPAWAPLPPVTYQATSVTLALPPAPMDYADNLPGALVNMDPTNSISSYDARMPFQMISALATRGNYIFQYCHDFNSSTGYPRLLVSTDLGATWLAAQTFPSAGPPSFDITNLLGGSITVLANGDLLVAAPESLSADEVYAIHGTVAAGGTVTWDAAWSIVSGTSSPDGRPALRIEVAAHPTDATKAYAVVSNKEFAASVHHLDVKELTVAGGTIGVVGLGYANGALTDSSVREPQIVVQPSNGALHVAWRYDTDDRPHYNDRSGTVWNTPETIDTYAHPNNNVLELKLNSQDVPYVLHTAGYTDTVASRGNAHVSRRLGESSWDRQNVYLGSTYGNGGEGSMAIDLATDAVYVTLSDDGPMGTSPDGLVYAIWPADMTVPVLAPTSIHPSPGTDSSWPWLVFTRAGGGPLAVTTFELATNQPRAIRIAG